MVNKNLEKEKKTKIWKKEEKRKKNIKIKKIENKTKEEKLNKREREKVRVKFKEMAQVRDERENGTCYTISNKNMATVISFHSYTKYLSFAVVKSRLESDKIFASEQSISNLPITQIDQLSCNKW